MKNNKGITMVALIVTIIVLLILASITVAFLLGDNGILSKAKQAAENTSKSQGQESLELALQEASVEKFQNSLYNANDYLDEIIKNRINNCVISGNKVNIDGYEFTINREKLKIEGITQESSLNNVNNASLVISTPNQFANFATQINSGDSFQGKTVVLSSDIDLSLVCSSTLGNWTPIGTNATNFSGTFDGNGYTISNLYINTTSGTIGLFGVVSSSGTLKNIKLSNSNISGMNQVGSICGCNNGIIENCINDSGTIIGTKEGVGGIAGANVGGIIRKSYNTSNINSSYYEIGGIVGYNYGTIEECYNTGNITSSNVTIGGITGGNYDTIMNCYNKGKIQSTGNDTFGGIAGYAATNIYSPSGLPKAIIKNSYNIGTIVTTGTWGKGGIVGNASNLAAINNYWLSTCGAAYGNSGSSPNNTGSTLKSDSEMKNLASTLGAAFVQDTSGINNGYPILKWQINN